jgi:hypothetical protein
MNSKEKANMVNNLKEEMREIVKRFWGIYIENVSKEYMRDMILQKSWQWISVIMNKELSIEFIREFKDILDWKDISEYQNISVEFFNEFKELIDMEIYKTVHRKISKEEKIQEMTRYAKRYKLKFDGENLYAYRNHDTKGRGSYHPTIFYENGKYYRDWHCDMRPKIKNSFGLGIWPTGNTPIKVAVDDWGLWIPYNEGKCRVWGFTVIGERKES